MRRTEFMLAVLVGRGAAIDEAMTFAALIDRHIFGSGLQEMQEVRFNEAHGLDSTKKLLDAISSLHSVAAAAGLPLLASWLARPATGPADEQFSLGLTFLLDGISARLPAGARRATSANRPAARRPPRSAPR